MQKPGAPPQKSTMEVLRNHLEPSVPHAENEENTRKALAPSLDPSVPIGGDEPEPHRGWPSPPSLDPKIPAGEDEAQPSLMARKPSLAHDVPATSNEPSPAPPFSSVLTPRMQSDVPISRDEEQKQRAEISLITHQNPQIHVSQDEGQKQETVSFVPHQSDQIRVAQDEADRTERVREAGLDSKVPIPGNEGARQESMAALAPHLSTQIPIADSRDQGKVVEVHAPALLALDRLAGNEAPIRRTFPLNGKLVTSEDPSTIGGNFQSLVNLSYTDTHLKAVSGMTKITSAVIVSPIDYTTFTESDLAGRLTVSSSTSLAVATLDSDETVYLFKDYGEGFFSGDFEFQVTANKTASSGASEGCAVWAMSNSIGDARTLIGSSGANILSVYILNETLYLSQSIAASETTQSYGISGATNYYLTIKRDESVGSYGKIYCYVYSDSGRTTLLTTLEVSLTSAKYDFRYLYAMASYNSATGGQSIDVTISNLNMVHRVLQSLYHFKKGQPAESHLLVQAGSSGSTKWIFDNTTAIPSAGNFTTTPLWAESPGSGIGRFSSAPGGNVAYTNGKDSCLWGGSELRCGAFITSTATVGHTVTNPKDYSDAMRNLIQTPDQCAVIGGGIDSATVFCCHGDDADAATSFTDSAGGKSITRGNHAVIDTDQYVFGGSSILLDGTDDYIKTADHADFNMGTGKLTIDMWVRFNSKTASQFFYHQRTDSSNYVSFFAGPTGNQICAAIYSGGSAAMTLTGSVMWETGKWYHVALIRGWGGNANDWAITVNGVAVVTSTTSVTWADYTGEVFFGTNNASAAYINGWLDEIRVSKGVARWTANFTPPVRPYTTAARTWVVGSTRRLKGVKFYVPSGRGNATASTMTCKEWAGGSWNPLTITDGTSSGGKSVAQTGSVSFVSTVPTSKIKYLEGYTLFFYQFSIDAGEAEIYHCTVDAPFQAITDIWDGVDRTIASAIRYNASVYFDDTVNLAAEDYNSLNTASYADWAGLGPTCSFYLGFTEQVMALNVTMVSGYENTTASVISIYLNNGGDWVLAGGVSDGTNVGGKTFNRSGTISWTPPESHQQYRTTIQKNINLYYVKIVFSVALSSGYGVRVDSFTGIPAPRPMKGYKFPLHAHNSLFLCGESDGRKNLAVKSAPYTSEVFNGEQFMEIEFGDDTELTGAESLYTQFGASIYNISLFYKANQTYALVEDQQRIWRYTVSNTVGLAAPLTLKTIELPLEAAPSININRNIAIWQGSSGIYVSDGRAPIPIHWDIRDRFDNRSSNYINPNVIGSFTGEIDIENLRYHWRYASGSSATLDKEMVFDLKRWKWFEIQRGSGNEIQYSCNATDTYGNTYVYGAVVAGYVERLEYGNTFDGTAITASFKTGDICLSEHVDALVDNRITHIDLAMVSKTVTANSATVTYYTDGKTSGSSVTLSPAKSGYRITNPVKPADTTLVAPGVFHSFLVTMTTNDEAIPFEPLYLSIFGEVVRERVQ